MELERRAFLAATLATLLPPLLDSMLAIAHRGDTIEKCDEDIFPGRDLGRIGPGSQLGRGHWLG
jgi:hypothetical protein